MNALRIALVLGFLVVVSSELTPPPSARAQQNDTDRIGAMEKRIATLERSLDTRERELKSRLLELERLVRSGNRRAPASGSKSGDLSQLQRESSSLRSAVRTLEGKVSTGLQFDTQFRREISTLRQKLTTLENRVSSMR